MDFHHLSNITKLEKNKISFVQVFLIKILMFYFSIFIYQKVCDFFPPKMAKLVKFTLDFC